MSSVTAVQHNETGSITLGVFFGLVLLGVVVTLTWSQMQVAERALRRLISTDRAYDRALVSLTERLNTAAVTSASTSARSALYGAGTFGEITIGATASVITNSARPSLGTAVIDGSQPLSISFPFIDLDHLLPPPTTCPESRGAEVGRSLTGRPLTVGALTSADTCRPAPRELTAGGAFHGNLFLPAGTRLEPATTDGIITVATAGFLEGVAPLEIRGAALLVAGGDLLLPILEASVPSSVTLVATTGRIEVGYLSPKLTVRALGYSGVHLPPHKTLSLHTPLPPLIERLLLGVQRGAP